MTYSLILGDRSYSSWSLRAWVLFDRFELPVDVQFVDFDADATVAQQLAAFAPARTVPAMRMSDGALMWDSLAIAEELASRHPDFGLWPFDPVARAMARAVAAEMHSGFAALRGECPMNLRTAYSDSAPSPQVRDDVARIEELWARVRAEFGGDGPWLCGEYCIADAVFAPIAARIAAYSLPVGDEASSCVAAHLADPSFRRWRAMGLAAGATLARYALDHPQIPWPGPAPLPAEAIDSGSLENAVCPYSGRPATHLLRMGDRIFGFCNAFRRDKTVADPEAWPAFMTVYTS